MIQAKIVGAAEASRALIVYAARADIVVRSAVRDGGQLIAQAMRAAASAGRPGPRVMSGELAGSMTVTGPERVGFGHYRAEIGPSGVVYARAIELGVRSTHHRRHPYAKPGLQAGKPLAYARYRAEVAAVRASV